MSNKCNLDYCFVHLFNDFSGSPRVLRDLIDAKISSTQNGFLFTSQHQGFLSGASAQKITCHYWRSNYKLIQLIYFLVSQLVVFFVLGQHLIKRRLHGRKTIVTINTMLPFGAGLASKLFAYRTIYYVHESWIRPQILKSFLRLIIESCATHVIFVSHYLAQCEQFKRPNQVVIHNGLRGDFDLPDNIDFEQKFEEKIVFFAGSLKRYKGVNEFIEMAIRLPKLQFCGALNCEPDDLDIFVKSHTLPSNLTFLSKPERIQDWYLRSFLVVNLSCTTEWVETFGLSLIEGMVNGSPVIAPPVGGPVEFVDKTNGFLIDANELDAIVQKVNFLCESEERWLEYAKAAIVTSNSFTASQYQHNIRAYFARSHPE